MHIKQLENVFPTEWNRPFGNAFLFILATLWIGLGIVLTATFVFGLGLEGLYLILIPMGVFIFCMLCNNAGFKKYLRVKYPMLYNEDGTEKTDEELGIT